MLHFFDVVNMIQGKTNGLPFHFSPLSQMLFSYICLDSKTEMPNPSTSPTRTDREALEMLMQHSQRLLAQFERLKSEHELVVQRARTSAEQLVRLQGEVDALKHERSELKSALEMNPVAPTTAVEKSHSTYSQPDPTSAALPKEVINEIVQEIDACIALLQR